MSFQKGDFFRHRLTNHLLICYTAYAEIRGYLDYIISGVPYVLEVYQTIYSPLIFSYSKRQRQRRAI